MTKELETFMTTTGTAGKEIEFAFDKDNKLHIDGKQVVTHEVVKLRCIELVFAAILTIATGIQATVEILAYYFK